MNEIFMMIILLSIFGFAVYSTNCNSVTEDYRQFKPKKPNINPYDLGNVDKHRKDLNKRK